MSTPMYETGYRICWYHDIILCEKHRGDCLGGERCKLEPLLNDDFCSVCDGIIKPKEARSMLKAKDWTPTETLFAFVGWLTSRKEVTVMSSSNAASPALGLIEEFCKRHDIPVECREGWEKAIK